MATSTTKNDTRYIPEFSAFVKAKCPRCRRGNMFANSMYNLTGQNMYQKCPHCGLTFEREPGYFYVAMYVSYALNVAEMVTIAVATIILTGSESPWLYAGLLLGSILILAPFNLRYSRVILLYWMTPSARYRPELSGDLPDEHTHNGHHH